MRLARLILVALLGIRSPEADLIDPIRLIHQTIRQTERLEHLDGAAGDAVGLTNLKGTVLAVDHGGPDVGKVGHLRGQNQTGRTAPDDQDIDFLGRPSGRSATDGYGSSIDGSPGL